jgi:hypothetical protein
LECRFDTHDIVCGQGVFGRQTSARPEREILGSLELGDFCEQLIA